MLNKDYQISSIYNAFQTKQAGYKVHFVWKPRKNLVLATSVTYLSIHPPFISLLSTLISLQVSVVEH